MPLTFTFHNPTQQALIHTSPYTATGHLHTLSQYTMTCQFSQTVTVCFDIHSVTEHFGMHITTYCHSMLWHVKLNKLPQNALACTISQTATVCFDFHFPFNTHCHSMLWHVQLNKLPQNALACTIYFTNCYSMLWHVQLNKLPQNALACTISQTATDCSSMYTYTNCHSRLCLVHFFNLPLYTLIYIYINPRLFTCPHTKYPNSSKYVCTKQCCLSSKMHLTDWKMAANFCSEDNVRHTRIPVH